MAMVGCREKSADQMSMEEEIISKIIPEPSAMIKSSANDYPMSPPSGQEQIHPRPVSFASRHGNRLSLSLLVQAGDRDTRYTPTSSDPSSRQDSPSREQLPTVAPNAFLVALAAQERKVFELKEELYQAEEELSRLKRQWASHEGSRSTERSGVEISQLEMRQMSPIITRGAENTSADEAEDHSTHSAKREGEMHRRKAILTGFGRDSRRKVISGGHTRALSLLSPVRQVHGDSPLLSSMFDSADNDGDVNSNALPRAIQVSGKTNLNKSRHSYQGSPIVDVKQIADDIKSGLWTFMEDLRQATVGDEPIKGMSAVGMSTKSSGPSKKGDTGAPVTADQILSRNNAGEKSTAGGREPRHIKTAASANPEKGNDRLDCVARTVVVSENGPNNTNSLDDDWSNWDSPLSKGKPGRWSDNIATSQNSRILSSSPNNSKSLKPFPRRDETLWPVLNSFTPGNIKRTASAIIKDWEKSLAAPIDSEKDSVNTVSDPTKKTVEGLESQLPSCTHP